MRFNRFLLAGFAATLLAGCSDKTEAPPPAEDPALSGALGDPIMVDPDLTGQDRGQDAVVALPATAEIPTVQRGTEAVAAAKRDAAKLAGGAIRPAPAAGRSGDAASLVERAATAAQVARAAGAGRADCAAKVGYAMRWAAELPGPLAVYPRAAVQEAAGTDSDGCRLRVVNFVTPVPAGDVLDYYYTRTSDAGYRPEHRMDGRDHVLGGGRDGAAFVIHIRTLPDGLTEVDLVSAG